MIVGVFLVWCAALWCAVTAGEPSGELTDECRECGNLTVGEVCGPCCYGPEWERAK